MHSSFITSQHVSRLLLCFDILHNLHITHLWLTTKRRPESIAAVASLRIFSSFCSRFSISLSWSSILHLQIKNWYLVVRKKWNLANEESRAEDESHFASTRGADWQLMGLPKVRAIYQHFVEINDAARHGCLISRHKNTIEIIIFFFFFCRVFFNFSSLFGLVESIAFAA